MAIGTGEDQAQAYPEYPVTWLEQGAPHLGHANHLCEMAKQGVALQTVKNLVKDANFICRVCGRAAANEDNLCEPRPL